MANSTGTNPLFFDSTTGGSKTGHLKIQCIQWIDDAGDVADGEKMAFTINGVTVTAQYNLGSDVGHQDAVLYQAGPFAKPIQTDADGFTLTTLTNNHGTVVVWLV